MPARVMGAPHLFLYQRFPTWKEDNKTYLVPPVSKHQHIGTKGSIPLPSKVSENNICNLLKKLGASKQIGMFVVHGSILQWNKEVCETEYEIQATLPTKIGENECDCIIFHHKLGVILIEVSSQKESVKTAIQDAVIKLEKSQKLIQTLTEVTDNVVDFTIRKVIAMPSTVSSDVDKKSYPDTLFLFKEDSKNVLAFENWWRESLEASGTPEVTSKSYEHTLSYILMLRHLSPVSEVDCLTDLHQTLVSSKYHDNKPQPQILESMFPKFWAWCQDVLQKKDRGYNFGNDPSDEAKEAFISQYDLNSEDLTGYQILKLIDKLLKATNYIGGNSPTKIDEILAVAFENSYYLYFRNIVRFINIMRRTWTEIDSESLDGCSNVEERYPFLKLESLSDLNTLDRHLANVSFIEGDQPSVVDKHLFETLTCQIRLTHARLPFVMTPDQLAVFEGPLKQLIIGPPGSGKTELMKFKALEMEQVIKVCEENKKILYIVANGSPGYKRQESLLFHYIKDFFKKSSLVEVLSIVIEEESPVDMEHTVSVLTEKITSKDYKHVFMDEYWIGSKPVEHEIVLKLVDGIPGYVWISSVFDFHHEKIHTSDRMIKRTKPLLDALERNSGRVSYVTQVLRATNSIINVERDYSFLYKDRTYPYGTQQIHNHSLKGLPVLWSVEKKIDDMYKKSVNLVSDALRTVLTLDKLSTGKLTLDPADIIIVNFAIRIKGLPGASSLEDYLNDAKIGFWKLSESVDDYVNCHSEKVTVLNSLTRENSSYLDGVEWPMVIVILPYDLLNGTAKLANGAEKLRNYDPYIALFRTMVKLVVISDKWKTSEDFLEDIALRSK